MPTITITPGWAGPLSAVGSAPVVVQVAGVGPTGAAGANGAAGPNTITTSTSTDFASGRGFLSDGDSVIPLIFGSGLTLTGDTLTASAGMAIGGTVTSGTAGRVLYVGAGPVLAQDARFLYTSNKLTLRGGSSGAAAFEVRLADDSNWTCQITDTGTMTIRDITVTQTFTVAAVSAGTLRGGYCHDQGNANPYFDLGFTSGTIAVVPRTSSQVPLTINGASGQTGDLQRWQVNGTTVGRVVPGATTATLAFAPLAVTLTANQNNWNPGVCRFLDVTISTGGPYTVTGIQAGVDGQELWLRNCSASASIVLAHDSASSTKANRIFSETSSDITIPPHARVSLVYSTPRERWEAYPSKQCT